MELFLMNRWSKYNDSNRFLTELSVTYKPVNTVSVSLSPSYSVSQDNLQYVTTIEGNGPDKYIMARLNSEQLSLSARVNVGITPDMSIQYYGQPFFFSGHYSHFKTITNSTAAVYTDRFHEFTQGEIKPDTESAIYSVDMDGNGTDYSFDDPNFHFLQYRSNLVFRWEYKPGSTFFLVWSQGKTTDGPEGKFIFNKYTDELSKAHPQNDFLIKVSYALIF